MTQNTHTELHPSHHLQQGHRIDWWRIIEDLRRTGLSIEGIADGTKIPKSTLMGYRNLDAEPKHADGEQLKQLWLRRMVPPLPLLRDGFTPTNPYGL